MVEEFALSRHPPLAAVRRPKRGGVASAHKAHKRKGTTMRVKPILAAILVAAVLASAALALPGCNALVSRDNAAANRLEAEATLERAEANRLQTEAEAYQRRLNADIQAAAERSALRQAERGAAHERTLELLPFMLLIVGVVVIGGLAVAALAGGLQRRQANPDVVLLLQRQDQRLAEIERAMWRGIAAEQRRQLSAGVGPVVVYNAEGRVIGDERGHLRG